MHHQPRHITHSNVTWLGEQGLPAVHKITSKHGCHLYGPVN